MTSWTNLTCEQCYFWNRPAGDLCWGPLPRWLRTAQQVEAFQGLVVYEDPERSTAIVGENNRRQTMRMQIFYSFYLAGSFSPHRSRRRRHCRRRPASLLLFLATQVEGRRETFLGGGGRGLRFVRGSVNPRTTEVRPVCARQTLCPSARESQAPGLHADQKAHLLPVCGSSAAECQVTARSSVPGSLLSVPQRRWTRAGAVIRWLRRPRRYGKRCIKGHRQTEWGRGGGVAGPGGISSGGVQAANN